jgi:CBS domain-containing membrane protein
MKRNPTLDSIITRDIETVQHGQPLSEVARLFREKDYHHAPVLDGRKPVGMISYNDIMRLIYDADNTDSHAIDNLLDTQFSIDKVMNKELTLLPLGTTIREAAQTLIDHHQHSVVIVDTDGDIAGILTSSDLIKHLIALI